MKEEKKEAPIGVLWGWGKPYHGKFIGSIILAVLGVACQMVPYFCVAHIVTMMLSGEQNFSRYVTAGIIALCGYFGKVLFSCLSTTISHTATYYTLRDLRENITAKLARVPMGTILDTPSGQYKTTIVDRVEGMESTFAHLIPEMTANVLVPLVIAVYLFLLDWRMALLSLVTLVVGLAVMSAGMKNYPVKWEGAVKAGKQMANAIVEYIGGIEVVKAFSQSAGSYKKYSDAVNYNANYYVDWMHENQKTMSAYNAILPSVLICVLPCGFAFWLSGSLELSTFLSIVIFSLGLIGPIIAAFTFTDDLAVLGTNVEEISQLLNAGNMASLLQMLAASMDTANSIDDTPVMDEKGADITPKSSEIVFNKVDFSYADRKILDQVSFTIPEKTTTAIVGPSGAGKTTMCNLIARFWDVNAGKITIGGTDVRDFKLDSLMKNISMVFQSVYLFADTIENNIKFGCPDATHEQVVEAAKKACCHNFISALPDGYDTVIGEGGGTLSGGEKQRIAIARAMLKDAPIIILDEATSSVDPENKDELQRAIEALTHDKTIIMIAHRLKTVRNADQILVLDNAHIVQRGTHAELIRQKGLYADFVSARQEAIGWKLAQ
ncbi:ABC transporter ATP-binding protein [Ruminococcus sp. OM05-7]|nr:ABC transporter ATP-binding protein [Ruminococcus sp. OM05-7]